MMMQLARMGASDAVIKRHVKGIDQDTIEVMRKIVSEEISKGRKMQIMPAEEDASERMAG